MKSLVSFWKKDPTNKLIVLVAAGLALGIVSLAVMLARMPDGKSLRGALADVVPGLDDPAAIPSILPATPTRPPTWVPHPTRTPTAPVFGTPTGIPASSELPSATLSPSPDATADMTASAACLPAGPAQAGRVVEIVDGNTIKVLINDKVYVVRYLGLITPDAENPFHQAAISGNSEIVFGHDVTLVADGIDKDPSGRLLRYVSVGETLVNLELIREGLAATDTSAARLSCAEAFAAAEQSAIDARAGQWSLPGPTRTP